MQCSNFGDRYRLRIIARPIVSDFEPSLKMTLINIYLINIPKNYNKLSTDGLPMDNGLPDRSLSSRARYSISERQNETFLRICLNVPNL